MNLIPRLLRTLPLLLLAIAGLVVPGSATAAPLTAAPAALAPPDDHRVAVYYQTHSINGVYLSPKKLLDERTGVTDVIVGALHLNGDGTVHLNDSPPSDPSRQQMWADLAAMQASGVRVTVMVGGAAQGTFQRLDKEFATYYPKLKNFITTYGLDGVDLDVEETMSLAGIERVIDQLDTDFGRDFTISLAPVAAALKGGGNLSGFNYETLEAERGAKIDSYNAQFYCGWGSMATTSDYTAIINRGKIPASKVVASTLTDPSLCQGYVDVTTTLKSTLQALVAKYPDFGGVAGWEYFTSQPGGKARPWEWAALMTSYLQPSANLALQKAATGSAACTSTEGPAQAVNGSVSGGNADKFCSTASGAWLQVDLGAAADLTTVVVKHAGAGGESASLNTKAFTIATSADGTTWTTGATVSANTASVTQHAVAARARYVKLQVSAPTQGTDPATRIYELEVYAGTGAPAPACTASSASAVAIPDLGTVESPVTVSGCAGNGSTSATVEVHARHTYSGDLVISLVAPDGTAYPLLNRSGGGTDNVDQTFTVDLSSEVRNGIWKLRVQDAARYDTGTLDRWTLTL